jgi:hypothetical protein
MDKLLLFNQLAKKFSVVMDPEGPSRYSLKLAVNPVLLHINTNCSSETFSPTYACAIQVAFQSECYIPSVVRVRVPAMLFFVIKSH